MSTNKMARAAIALLIAGTSTSAFAGPPGSVALTIGILAPVGARFNLNIVVPVLTGLTDLPVLSKVKLPVIGGLTTLPGAERQTVSLLLAAGPNVAILQTPLPGLGVIDSALTAILPKSQK